MRLPYLIIITLSLSCTNSNNETKHQAKTDTLLRPTTPILISDSSNTLEKEIKTLKLQYTVFGCACANWTTSEDVIKYRHSSYVEHHIFIERADTSLYDPEFDSTFSSMKHKIIVTGQFYVKKDYPHPTYKMEESLDKARVFRYTKIKRITEDPE